VTIYQLLLDCFLVPPIDSSFEDEKIDEETSIHDINVVYDYSDAFGEFNDCTKEGSEKNDDEEKKSNKYNILDDNCMA